MEKELESPDELAKALAAMEPSAGKWDDLEVERLSVAGRIDALVACEQLMRHVQALLVRILGVMAQASEAETGLDEGCTEAEVVAALRLSSATVKLRLDQARTLTEWFPETVDLLASGQVSWPQVTALVDATASLDIDIARRVQDRVLKLMPDQNPAATRKALRRAVLAADPEGAQERHDYEARRRRVELRAEEDGMATLSLYTTAEMAPRSWLPSTGVPTNGHRVIRAAWTSAGLTAWLRSCWPEPVSVSARHRTLIHPEP